MSGQLEEFCDTYRKSKRLPSISQLVLTGLPGGIGNEGNRVARKCKREEITSRTPLVTSDSSTGSSSHALSGSQSLPQTMSPAEWSQQTFLPTTTVIPPQNPVPPYNPMPAYDLPGCSY